MVLDKTSIEEILYTDGKEFEKIAESKKDGIFIRTDTEQNYFDKSQIGNDSIDLRIANYGYKMRVGYNYINTLSNESFEKFYKKINLHECGYILKPGHLIFVPTLERIALSGNLIGRITGRSVFARMGLSVHCTQDKFSSGINSVAGLQIINHSPVPLKIFPRQMLAQLLIERTGQNRHPYEGTYCEEKNYKLPLVNDKDRAQYNEITKHLIALQTPKRLSIVRREQSSLSLSICKLIFSIVATVCMTYFGMIGNVTALFISGGFELLALICFTIIEFSLRREKSRTEEDEIENEN